MIFNKNKGFTLVEILIALAILAMIVLSTFTIFKSSSQSWQKGESRSERYHNARTAVYKLSREISNAVIREGKSDKFIGSKDEIKFISYIAASDGSFELAEVGYWFDSISSFLMRMEDLKPDYDLSTQDSNDILASNISEIEFAYYDGISWLESWNSALTESPMLPKAVRITIEVADKSGKEKEKFEVISRLKTAF